MAVCSQKVGSFLKHAAVSAISLAAILAVGTLSAGVVELSLTVDPVRELGRIKAMNADVKRLIEIASNCRLKLRQTADWLLTIRKG